MGMMPFDRTRTIRQFIRGCFKNKKQMKIKNLREIFSGEGSIKF
jgi:hypothetical protein